MFCSLLFCLCSKGTLYYFTNPTSCCSESVTIKSVGRFQWFFSEDLRRRNGSSYCGDKKASSVTQVLSTESHDKDMTASSHKPRDHRVVRRALFSVENCSRIQSSVAECRSRSLMQNYVRDDSLLSLGYHYLSNTDLIDHPGTVLTLQVEGHLLIPSSKELTARPVQTGLFTSSRTNTGILVPAFQF